MPLIPSAGPPSFVTDPREYTGPDPIGRAIMNVLTLGNAAHPGSLRAGALHDLSMFDPRHPAGAANLAGMMLGRLTPEQGQFLEAIRQTSRGRSALMPEATSDVGALAGLIGSPLNAVGEPAAVEGSTRAFPGLLRGAPAWLRGYPEATRSEAGMGAGTNLPEFLTHDLGRTLLQRLLGRYNTPTSTHLQGLTRDPEATRAFLNALIQSRMQDTG